MDKKQIKMNILIVLVISFLIISALMMRFEFNPFSYFVETGDKDEDVVLSEDNSNGIYRYRETLSGSFSLFYGCAVSYFDNYILIVNDNYFTYRHSCIGTFLTGRGKTKDLKFKQTIEKTKYIDYNDKDYYKTDLVSSLKTNNFLKDRQDDIGVLYPENYKLLLKESQHVDNYFDIKEAFLRSSPAMYNLNLKHVQDSIFDLNILFPSAEEPVYSYRVDNFDDLPELRFFGPNSVIIEPIINGNRYSYGFKVYSETSLKYDIKSMFPIIVDGVTLSNNNSIYIGFNESENKYIMLVGNDMAFCVSDSKSDNIAYYVFEISYNYYNKGFDNPKYIKKMYERDGCKYVDEVMRWNR